MDLEKFPASKTALKMLDMVSHGFYDDSYVGKWLYQIMGAQLDVIGASIEDLPYQSYVDTATWGLRYWEQLYGIETDETLSYEERRAEIHAIEAVGMPINPERIRMTLENITGRTWAIEEINSEYRFLLTVYQGEDTVNWKRIIAWLNKVKPAHLSYSFDIDIQERLDLSVGIVVKDLKELSADEETYDEDPINDNGDFFIDEDWHILADENGNGLLDDDHSSEDLLNDENQNTLEDENGDNLLDS